MISAVMPVWSEMKRPDARGVIGGRKRRFSQYFRGKWEMDYIARFETLSMHDVDKVGGKNSSLGEMIHNLTDKGVRVPGGFATTADAFREFCLTTDLPIALPPS
jgi:hypothetical protein